MNIKIRSEQPKDFNKIAELNHLAFIKRMNGQLTQYMSEVSMVSTFRNGSNYDPSLSLVAEIDGQIVGHGMFSSFKIFINGKQERGVLLAPLATHPNFQRKGIGGKILAEGHRIAKEKGCSLAILVGHTSYYPKFGYQTGMYSFSGISISVKDLPNDCQKVSERPITLKDLDTIKSIWQECNKDNFAIYPGDSITDWVNYSKTGKVVVLTINGELIGYIRYETKTSEKLKTFICKKESINQVLCYIANKNIGKEKIILPYHHESKFVKEYISIPFSREFKEFEPAMIKVLDESNDNLINYINIVKKDKNKAGVISFPPICDAEGD